MIDQIIEFNIMSPLLGDGYKAGGIGEIKTHPLVPKDVVVRGFIKQVNQRAWQSAIVLIVLLLLIALMIWALVSFGSYLYSLVASIFCSNVYRSLNSMP